MKFVLALAAVVLAGCATTAPQAKSVLEDQSPWPKSARVENVPFVDYEDGYCGPSSLAIAMKWAGHDVSVDELSKRVLTSGKSGSLQNDMIGATRREGLMAVRIEGYPSLLNEITDGHPVVIFENLGLSWYTQWHYAIVVGYDLERREVTMHSGPTPNEVVDMKVFERSWKLGDYWAIVVLPPGEISRSAGELENARAAAGLELAGHPEAAEKSYRAILETWPKSLSARIGLANLAYGRKEFQKAVAMLEEAHFLHPESEIVKNNLAVARKAFTDQ